LSTGIFNHTAFLLSFLNSFRLCDKRELNSVLQQGKLLMITPSNLSTSKSNVVVVDDDDDDDDDGGGGGDDGNVCDCANDCDKLKECD
jgi:hypothetical protein